MSYRITFFSPYSCLISSNKIGYYQCWNDGYCRFILYTHNIYSSSSPTTNKLKRPTFQMLAIGQSSIAGMTPLPGVTEEIAFIQKFFGVEALTLDERKATVDGVAESLPTCSWAHFACHGVQDPDKPMDSGLVMWDRHLLTLSRLAQSSLASAEFTFLSCCESAKGSKQFPNEAMHLAAGLQFIGYCGLLGQCGLWEIRTLSVLRCRFMENCLKMVQAGLLLLRQHLHCTRPSLFCTPIMFPLPTGYHLFTLVYDNESASSCPTFKNFFGFRCT